MNIKPSHFSWALTEEVTLTVITNSIVLVQRVVQNGGSLGTSSNVLVLDFTDINDQPKFNGFTYDVDDFSLGLWTTLVDNVLAGPPPVVGYVLKHKPEDWLGFREDFNDQITQLIRNAVQHGATQQQIVADVEAITDLQFDDDRSRG